MAWAIIAIYSSKCAQMNPQQLTKTSKFYSKCKMCDIEKTCTHPLGSPKVNLIDLSTEFLNYTFSSSVKDLVRYHIWTKSLLLHITSSPPCRLHCLSRNCLYQLASRR